MDAVAIEPHPEEGQNAIRGPAHGIWYLNFAILLIVAVLTRAHQYWNPVAHLDDQFYLMVGRAMLDGQLPYVDIWDRKPFGLFLLYSGIAALGGTGVIQAQLVATLFAALAAFVISRIGDRIAPFPGGLLGGAIYLALMPMFSGGSGQAQVFYNLPMALAALWTLDAWQDRGDPACWRRGALVMAAVGIALTIKPTTLFEGCAFGIMFLAMRWRQTGSVPAVLALVAGLIAIALLPTALTFGYFWAIGGLIDIWQATVVSVLAKQSLPPLMSLALIFLMAVRLSVPSIAILLSLRRLGKEDRRARNFFAIWLGAAAIGFLSIPNFFDHYGLPLLVPGCAVMAVVLAQPVKGLAWAAGLAAFGSLLSNNLVAIDGPARAAQFDRVAAVVSKNLHGGCLYVFEGPVHLYTATGACRLTRFVFPDHLNSAIEANALPVRQTEEIGRIFEQRPAVVVAADRWFLDVNEASLRTLRAQLACNYRLIEVADEYGVRFDRPLSIWARRPGWRHCDAS